MSLAAPNLFDILMRVHDELGGLKYGLATGGSSTTLVDSGLGGSDDDWNDGTVFVVEADGAAPEGEFAEITDYAQGTGTLTFSSTGINGISSAPAALDEYALASSKYKLDKMRGVINRALTKLPVLTVDESLTTAANTKEYTIPAVANDALRRVYIAQTSTASNEGWVQMFNWYQEANVLIFRSQPVTGKTIKLDHMAAQARLAAYSDLLSNFIPLNRIVAEAYFLADVERIRRKGGRSVSMKRKLDDAKIDLAAARRQWKIYDPGTPFKPIL
ncbi:hypothetical protein LCGC14_2901250, partial [marine sediment metagenome]